MLRKGFLVFEMFQDKCSCGMCHIEEHEVMQPTLHSTIEEADEAVRQTTTLPRPSPGERFLHYEIRRAVIDEETNDVYLLKYDDPQIIGLNETEAGRREQAQRQELEERRTAVLGTS